MKVDNKGVVLGAKLGIGIALAAFASGAIFATWKTALALILVLSTVGFHAWVWINAWRADLGESGVRPAVPAGDTLELVCRHCGSRVALERQELAATPGKGLSQLFFYRRPDQCPTGWAVTCQCGTYIHLIFDLPIKDNT